MYIIREKRNKTTQTHMYAPDETINNTYTKQTSDNKLNKRTDTSYTGNDSGSEKTTHLSRERRITR